MDLSEFNSFSSLAQERGMLFYYSGYFSETIVAAVGDAVRNKLDTAEASNSTRRKVFSTFVEMAQNITHYSDECLVNAEGKELRYGTLALGRLNDGNFFIVCGNQVKLENIDRLTNKIEPLRQMTLEEIKQAYKVKLREENEATSKGAGLGFLTVARDAKAPIEYTFVMQQGETGPTAFFFLKAVI
jgi:hypothetical protein